MAAASASLRSGGIGSASVPALAAGLGGSVADEESTPREDRDDDGSSILPIALWLCCACGSALYSKFLFETSFPFPLSLTALHLCAATLASSAMQGLGMLSVPRLGWGGWLCSVVPISVLYALSLGGSNIAASRVSLSFLQMLKALMPGAALLVGALSCSEVPALRHILFTCLALGGVALSAAGEQLWDAPGVGAQVASALSEALRLAAAQRLLQPHLPPGASPLVSVAMLAPPAAALLLPAAAALEPLAASYAMDGSSLRWAVEDAARVAARWRTPMQLLASCVGYLLLNAAVVLLVRRTSGSAVTLAGVAKDALLVLASVLVFQAPVTPQQVASYALTLWTLNVLDAYKAERDAPTSAILTTALTNRR